MGESRPQAEVNSSWAKHADPAVQVAVNHVHHAQGGKERRLEKARDKCEHTHTPTLGSSAQLSSAQHQADPSSLALSMPAHTTGGILWDTKEARAAVQLPASCLTDTRVTQLPPAAQVPN